MHTIELFLLLVNSKLLYKRFNLHQATVSNWKRRYVGKKMYIGTIQTALLRFGCVQVSEDFWHVPYDIEDESRKARELSKTRKPRRTFKV